MITRPHHQQTEIGSSMVELMTTLGIMGLVMTTLFAAIGSTTSVLGGTEQRFTNMGEARTLMGVMTKDIRTATRLSAGTSPFVIADKREITFYANLNNANAAPKKAHMYVTTGNILVAETQTADASSVAPNYTYTGAAVARYVGRYVANTTAQPLFTYYDINGAEIAAPVTNLLSIYSVKVTLVVRKQTTNPVRSVTLVNQVRLPNVDYQAQAG